MQNIARLARGILVTPARRRGGASQRAADRRRRSAPSREFVSKGPMAKSMAARREAAAARARGRGASSARRSPAAADASGAKKAAVRADAADRRMAAQAAARFRPGAPRGRRVASRGRSASPFARVSKGPSAMARLDFTTPRLCLDRDLREGESAALSPLQAHYLLDVLRLGAGARVLVFNGRDGEFAASVAPAGRKGAALAIGARTRAQERPPDVDYLFAPLKHARLDYMAQKAVEMGARRLRPTLTRRTQATRVNLERLAANAREAAEQCGVIWLPEIDPPAPLTKILAAWPAERLMAFCDEDAPVANPVAALESAAPGAGASLLIGPEGGFDDDERAAILRLPRVVRLNLGPRILRADTAAVAALALIQSRFGDWR
jgi:16S rRNA (uracil1498-N3)-methyltransferase